MDQYNNKYKNPNNETEKPPLRCRYGNSNLYNYKNPYGRTIQVVRPAIVKIKTLE